MTVTNNEFCFRPARPGDEQEIGEIFAYARQTIAALGINQWQNGYPGEEIIRADIAGGISHAAVLEGRIAAVLSIISDGEPTYDIIVNGRWLTDGPYLTVHRFAVGKDFRGRSLPAKMFDYAEEIARSMELPSIRIDTHQGNVVMRRTLEKNGFTACGIIYLENGDERIAYEKILR